MDLDKDGCPELFLATGNVYPELRLPAYLYRTPRLLFRSLGNGKFEELLQEAGPGVEASHSSRGCAFGDFDNDGDLDILIINLNEPPSLLRNDVRGENRWLKVKLIGAQSNRSAIGARVTVAYGENGRRRRSSARRVTSPVATGACTSVWEQRKRRISKSAGRMARNRSSPKSELTQLVVIREGAKTVEPAPWPGR